jgi:diguanylate cyclase (GGDEF)-like protein
MSENLRSRKRRDMPEGVKDRTSESSSGLTNDLESFSKEVLNSLITDHLPLTPNNFSAYFDKLLENKNSNLRKEVATILELEENNESENSIVLEQNLKTGFTAMKNILGITANLYKNMSLMTKILAKRKKELVNNGDMDKASSIVNVLEGDILKLNNIVKKQSTSMKLTYDEIATIVKTVDNETVFDNQFGVYNKRYLMSKIEREIELIKEFKHKSSLIMIELDKDLKADVNNDKATMLMSKTIARLLLKTSRRSDIVAHYGNGVFAMLLKHTDASSAKKASQRLCELISDTNFFILEKEIKLKISIGISEVFDSMSVEALVIDGLDAIEEAYKDSKKDFAVSSKTKSRLYETRK